jgi:hypothetical protein
MSVSGALPALSVFKLQYQTSGASQASSTKPPKISARMTIAKTGPQEDARRFSGPAIAES